jgi:pimeloyl-ACP methyl ester carboxylesterase
MRVFALTWPFSFGVRLGWATTCRPNPEPERTRGRVYLFRGNGIVFSRGFGSLCDRLRAEELWAEDLRCVGDRWVRKQLRADHAARRRRGPVILVGHSCGGRYALYTAQELARLGILIELLICVDVAMPFEVPANVRHAVHLYRSRRRIYPARPLRRALNSAARIENLDLDAEDSVLSPAGLYHLNITASSALQNWVVARILRAVREAEERGE